MKETLEDLKAIIAGAPHDSQCVMMVCNPIYLKLQNDMWFAACSGQQWVQVTDKQIGPMRLLSDINEIIEFREYSRVLEFEIDTGGQTYGDLVR